MGSIPLSSPPQKKNIELDALLDPLSKVYPLFTFDVDSFFLSLPSLVDSYRIHTDVSSTMVG